MLHKDTSLKDYLKQDNLQRELFKQISHAKLRNYWFSYYFQIIKRFFLLTLFIFIFQYITSAPFKSLLPAPPMFPPIGIAFIMFYLFGVQALLGLLLGGILVYVVNGFALTTIVLYLSADIVGGYIGAKITQNIFSSDIYIFSEGREINQFILKNAFFTCIFSSVLRTAALGIEYYHSTSTAPVFTLIYNGIDLWLSDLNAILILAGFILAWVFTPFSRASITQKPFNFYHAILFVLAVIIPIIYLKHISDIYLLIPIMISALFLSTLYGSFIIIAQMFVFATLYLAYFLVFKYQYYIYLGHPGYTLISLYLLVYTLGCFYFSNLYDNHLSNTNENE